jgi:hypothetical protein
MRKLSESKASHPKRSSPTSSAPTMPLIARLTLELENSRLGGYFLDLISQKRDEAFPAPSDSSQPRIFETSESITRSMRISISKKLRAFLVACDPCAKGRAPMMLVRISLARLNLELRTFKCFNCDGVDRSSSLRLRAALFVASKQGAAEWPPQRICTHID